MIHKQYQSYCIINIVPTDSSRSYYYTVCSLVIHITANHNVARWQNENYFRETVQMDKRRWKVQGNLFVNNPIFICYIIKVIHKCVNLQPQNSCCHYLHPVHTVCLMAFILVTTSVALIQLSKWNVILSGTSQTISTSPVTILSLSSTAEQNKLCILTTYKYRKNIYCSQHHSSRCEVLFSRQVPAFCSDLLLSSSGQNGMFLENILLYAKTDVTLSQNMITYTRCNECRSSDTFSVRGFFRQLCQWMIGRRSTFPCHDY